MHSRRPYMALSAAANSRVAALRTAVRLSCLRCGTNLSPHIRAAHCFSRDFASVSVVAMASAGGSSSDVGGAALPLNHQDGTAVQPEAPTSPLTVLDSISLSSEERALFDTLLAAARYAGGGTVLRAAGGWVRDKLLGHDSKDIDIALDNMLGRDFADKVCSTPHSHPSAAAAADCNRW